MKPEMLDECMDEFDLHDGEYGWCVQVFPKQTRFFSTSSGQFVLSGEFSAEESNNLLKAFAIGRRIGIEMGRNTLKSDIRELLGVAL